MEHRKRKLKKKGKIMRKKEVGTKTRKKERKKGKKERKKERKKEKEHRKRKL